MNIRIIPRLDIKGPNLVKGIHFEGLRVLGKPEDFARHYYENGADELIYQDAVASLYGRNSLLETIERTAREIFIPLTVGGGIRTLEDISKALRAGADKVAINTAALHRPELISEAARRFGSSTIVVSIEAIKTTSGYEAVTNYGREPTGVDAVQWAHRAAELGAGELMVTSISNEGTGLGFDLDLTKVIAESVPIPVIAGGGAGTAEHVFQAIEQGHAEAVALASILHYDFVNEHRATDRDYHTEGNTEFLRKGLGFGRVQATSLPAIKRALGLRGVACRPLPEVTQ